jgi:hypothetical protein
MSLLLNLGNSITAGTDPYQFYNFRERVLADGATVLSDTQVSDEIKRLRSLGLYSKFSALYTPAVRNTSKLYSIISADGDATVTRGSVKNINSVTGTLEEIASDVTPSSFGTGGWGALVEGARTNLLLRSEELATSPWGNFVAGTGVTPVSTNNAGVSPDGMSNATRLQLDCGDVSSSANRSGRSTSVTVVNATTYSVSVYIKAFDSANIGKTVRLEWNNSGITPAIITLTENWQRIERTGTTIGTSFGFLIETRGTFTTQTADVLVFGAQLEAGSFASSYMKTEGATFTRSADVITKTGASDLIGQTEGTLFAVVDARINSQGFRRIMVIDDGAETGSTALRMNATNQVQLVSLNTTAQAVINSASNQQGLLKIAGVFAQDDFRLYVNGSLAGTDTSGTIPALRNVIRIGLSNDTTNQTNWFDDRILLAGISKTALTQAEAIALTT